MIDGWMNGARGDREYPKSSFFSFYVDSIIISCNIFSEFLSVSDIVLILKEKTTSGQGGIEDRERNKLVVIIPCYMCGVNNDPLAHRHEKKTKRPSIRLRWDYEIREIIKKELLYTPTLPKRTFFEYIFLFFLSLAELPFLIEWVVASSDLLRAPRTLWFSSVDEDYSRDRNASQKPLDSSFLFLFSSEIKQKYKTP